MNNVRIGIAGYGNMGSAHAACIASGKIEGLQLTAVCDIDEVKRKKCAADYPGISLYDDFEVMLREAAIDAVIVAVPHPKHALLGIKALRAGKHLLTEKPEDISVSAARKLNAAAKESGKVFAIMFNQRTHPLFRKAREIVQSGELGELKRSVWIITNWYRTQFYYDSGAWRATWSGEGGGVLLNQAPHNLDLWQWICGMPVSVTGFCDVAKYHKIEVEDDATLYVRYANGATGVFITTTGEYPGTNRLEIAGDRGKLVLENGLLKWWKLNQSEREYCFNANTGSANIDMEYNEIPQTEPETAHAGILQNFTNAILHGEALISPGEEGINELTLSNAAYLSEWKGNVAIDLPFDETAFDDLLSARAANSRVHAGEAENAGGKYNARWQVNW